MCASHASSLPAHARTGEEEERDAAAREPSLKSLNCSQHVLQARLQQQLRRKAQRAAQCRHVLRVVRCVRQRAAGVLAVAYAQGNVAGQRCWRAEGDLHTARRHDGEPTAARGEVSAVQCTTHADWCLLT